MKRCPQCGFEINDDRIIHCTNCGALLKKNSPLIYILYVLTIIATILNMLIIFKWLSIVQLILAIASLVISIIVIIKNKATPIRVILGLNIANVICGILWVIYMFV